MSVFSPAARLEWLIYRHIRFIHVLKISLALLIAHLIDHVYPVPYLAWTSVTIVIIMLTLPQVGGALEKSIQRVIGTLCGAAYGIGVLYISQTPWLTALLVLLAIAFVTWRASGKMSYAYLVAGFTLMIVLDGGEQGMREAIWRTATILLGCLIAITVSQLVLPLRSRNEWRWLLAASLTGMAQVWLSHLSPNVYHPLPTKGRLKELERNIQRQRGLLRSVTLESRSLRHSQRELDMLVEAQGRCLLLIELIAQSRWESSDSAQSIQHHYPIGLRARSLAIWMEEAGRFCSGERAVLPALESISELKQYLGAHLGQGGEPTLNTYGYGWLIYQCGLQLALLEKLLRNLAQIKGDSTPVLDMG